MTNNYTSSPLNTQNPNAEGPQTQPPAGNQGTAPSQAGFALNADGTYAPHVADGQHGTPVQAKVTFKDGAATSEPAQDLAPVQPLQLKSSAAMLDAFDGLKARRENWELHQLRASNDVLYGILGDCYAIYVSTQKSDTLREKFLKLYDAKYGKCKSNTSVATKIVWAVFGKQLEQRAFNYSNVLRNVYYNLNNKSGKTFREYVIEVGGIEEIRRTGGKTDAAKAKSEAERQTAIANLKSIIGIAKGLHIQLPAEQQEKNAEHSFRAALIREDAGGTFTIVMVSSSEVPINSMIAEFFKRDDVKPAPSASGTAEALGERNQLIAENVNA